MKQRLLQLFLCFVCGIVVRGQDTTSVQITPSPVTPSTSPISSSAIPSSGQNYTYNGTLGLNQTWNDKLWDNTSDEYRKISADIEERLTRVFQNETGFLAVKVDKLSNGSIIVIYSLVMKVRLTLTKESLNLKIDAAFNGSIFRLLFFEIRGEIPIIIYFGPQKSSSVAPSSSEISSLTSAKVQPTSSEILAVTSSSSSSQVNLTSLKVKTSSSPSSSATIQGTITTFPVPFPFPQETTSLPAINTTSTQHTSGKPTSQLPLSSSSASSPSHSPLPGASPRRLSTLVATSTHESTSSFLSVLPGSPQHPMSTSSSRVTTSRQQYTSSISVSLSSSHLSLPISAIYSNTSQGSSLSQLVHSKTISTVLATTTTYPTIPKKQKVFGCTLKLNRDWNANLNNSESPEYKKLAGFVEGNLTKVFKKEPGFVSVKVDRFFPGSVGVDLTVVMNATSNSTSKSLEQSILKANSSGNITLPVSSVSVQSKEVSSTGYSSYVVHSTSVSSETVTSPVSRTPSSESLKSPQTPVPTSTEISNNSFMTPESSLTSSIPTTPSIMTTLSSLSTTLVSVTSPSSTPSTTLFTPQTLSPSPSLTVRSKESILNSTSVPSSIFLVYVTSSSLTSLTTLSINRTLSPSPSLTIQGTQSILNATSVPPSILTNTFNITLKLPRNWNSNLSNSGSQEYSYLAGNISEKLSDVLKNISGFTSIMVKRFFEGSVGVDIVVLMKGSANVTTESLIIVIEQANSTGSLGFIITEITETKYQISTLHLTYSATVSTSTTLPPQPPVSPQPSVTPQSSVPMLSSLPSISSVSSFSVTSSVVSSLPSVSPSVVSFSPPVSPSMVSSSPPVSSSVASVSPPVSSSVVSSSPPVSSSVVSLSPPVSSSVVSFSVPSSIVANIFNITLKLPRNWNSNLSNSGSQEYSYLAGNITEKLSDVLKNISGFTSIMVKRFFEGSVGVDIVVLMKGSANVTTESLIIVIEQANSTGSLGFIITEITETKYQISTLHLTYSATVSTSTTVPPQPPVSPQPPVTPQSSVPMLSSLPSISSVSSFSMTSVSSSSPPVSSSVVSVSAPVSSSVASVSAPVSSSVASVSAPVSSSVASVSAPVSSSVVSVSAPVSSSVVSVSAPVSSSVASVSAPVSSSVASVSAPVSSSVASVSAPVSSSVVSVSAPVSSSVASVSAPVSSSVVSVSAPVSSSVASVSAPVSSSVVSVSAPVSSSVVSSSPSVSSSVISSSPSVSPSVVSSSPSVSPSMVLSSPSVSPSTPVPSPSLSSSILTTSSIMTTPTVPTVTQKFKCKFKLKRIWSQDLRYSYSPGFKVLAREIEEKITKVLSTLPGFLSVIILKFYQGSVGVEMDVFSSPGSGVTEASIENSIKSANSSGTLGLNLAEINVEKEDKPTTDDGGMETWVIVVIIASVVVFVLLIIIIVLAVCVKRLSKKKSRYNLWIDDSVVYSRRHTYVNRGNGEMVELSNYPRYQGGNNTQTNDGEQGSLRASYENAGQNSEELI